MRFGISTRIFPGVRVGLNLGGRRKPRLWASERLGPIRVTESTNGGRRAAAKRSRRTR